MDVFDDEAARAEVEAMVEINNWLWIKVEVESRDSKEVSLEGEEEMEGSLEEGLGDEVGGGVVGKFLSIHRGESFRQMI